MNAAYITWGLRAALAGFFGFHAYLKLTGHPADVALFEQIGVGQWFRYVTGAVEAVAAVLLLLPGTQILGALLIVGTMIGAMATKLFITDGGIALELALAILSLWLVWQYRGQFRRP